MRNKPPNENAPFYAYVLILAFFAIFVFATWGLMSGPPEEPTVADPIGLTSDCPCGDNREDLNDAEYRQWVIKCQEDSDETR